MDRLDRGGSEFFSVEDFRKEHAIISPKAILMLSLLLVCFTSNYHLLLTTEVKLASGPLMLMFLCLLRPMYLFLREHGFRTGIFQVNKVFLILWLTFGSLVLLSEIYHGDVIEGLFFLYIVPFGLFYAVNTVFSDRELHIINIVSAMPFFLMAFLFVLKGHKFNTNSIALIVLFAGISLLCFKMDIVRRRSFLAFFMYEILLGIVLLVLFRINSRTAMIGFMAAYAVTAVINIITVLREKHKDRAKYIMYYSLLFIVLLLGMGLILNKLDKVLYKWGGDFSSNRFTIWEITLEKAHILGRGYDFYTSTMDPDPALIGISLKGPHSILFGILGYTGLAAGAVFLVILLKFIKDVILTSLTAEGLRLNTSIIVFTVGYLGTGALEGFFQFPFYRTANIIWLMQLGRFYYSRVPGRYSVRDGVKESVLQIRTEEKMDIERYRTMRNEQIFWLLVLMGIALSSVFMVPGDGNIAGILKVLQRYIK